MAMILYPQTMKKAQAEIDSLLGADGVKMPGFSDINDLPYCVALTKEVLRWAPAAPGGFPHYSDADDEYKGFKVRPVKVERVAQRSSLFQIKAKSIVIPCTWSMVRSRWWK